MLLHLIPGSKKKPNKQYKIKQAEVVCQELIVFNSIYRCWKWYGSCLCCVSGIFTQHCVLLREQTILNNYDSKLQATSAELIPEQIKTRPSKSYFGEFFFLHFVFFVFVKPVQGNTRTHFSTVWQDKIDTPAMLLYLYVLNYS